MKDNPERTLWLLYLMEQFINPYNKQDGYAPLLVSLGHLFFDDED